MIAVTERKCVEGKFTLRMSVTEFATRADAKRYMDYLKEIPVKSQPSNFINVYDRKLLRDQTSPSGWRPAAPAEDFTDLDYRSNPAYESDSELGPWSIQNILTVQTGSLTLEVSGETKDVFFDPYQFVLLGDMREQQSEQLMDKMLAAIRTH